jgi:hypothetical protein
MRRIIEGRLSKSVTELIIENDNDLRKQMLLVNADPKNNEPTILYDEQRFRVHTVMEVKTRQRKVGFNGGSIHK